MNIQEIMVRSPVDRMAALVTSQINIPEQDADLRSIEIIELLARLRVRQSALKLVLGINTKAQHRNAVYKFNCGFKCFRREKYPREMAEYLRAGEAMQILNAELSERRKARRFVSEQMRGAA